MTTIVLITGVSGSGKSSLARHLAARGEHAISLDAQPRLCRLEDDHGRPVTRPDRPDTFGRHRCAWQADVLDGLISAQRQAGHDRVFFCGTASNQHHLLDRFDLALMLDIDAELMLARLNHAGRGGSGRGGASRRLLVDRFQHDRAAMRATVRNIIDADAPVEVIANMVCALAALHKLELSHV